jgi:hypothetical protein
MLQPLQMLLIAFTSQKCTPLQGYTLNPTCNFFLSLLQKYFDHFSLYAYRASIVIPFVGSLKFLLMVGESK